MDWFLYDISPRNERVKHLKLCDMVLKVIKPFNASKH